MSEKKVQESIDAFREYAHSRGWSASGREIHNGIYQLRIIHGAVITPINFYPTGTVLIQGNRSELQSDLKSWWQQKQTQSGQSPLWSAGIPPSTLTISDEQSNALLLARSREIAALFAKAGDATETFHHASSVLFQLALALTEYIHDDTAKETVQAALTGYEVMAARAGVLLYTYQDD